MCGRYILTSAPEALRRAFAYPEQPNMPPRFNIAPTQPNPVVLLESGERHFRLMRWGFIPAWVKDPRTFSLVINARSETVLEKPAFKNAIKRRRCLVPADGYYEWQAAGPRKQPYLIRPADGQPMGLAGLCETWSGPNGEEVDTVAIVTAVASESMSHLHHRVPVMIAPRDFERWLDGNAMSAEEACGLLHAPPDGFLTWHPVSSAVNRVANDNEGLIAPVEVTEDEPVIEEMPVKRVRAAKQISDETQGSLF